MHSHLLAQITNPVLPKVIGNAGKDGGTAIGVLVGNLVSGIMIIAFLLAFFILLSGGISWITAGGDKAQLENARNKIMNAIVGLIIIASIWAIMSILGPFLGLTFPNLPIPTIQIPTTTISNSPGSGSTARPGIPQ
jgi:hypothetical protein